jgi:hypothetical protein
MDRRLPQASPEPLRSSVEAADEILREAEAKRVGSPSADQNEERTATSACNFSFSEAIGVPLLLSDPTPLSSALSVPTLLNESRPAPGR